MLTRGSRRAVAQLQAVLATDIDASRCVVHTSQREPASEVPVSDVDLVAGWQEPLALLLLRPPSLKLSPKGQCLVV